MIPPAAASSPEFFPEKREKYYHEENVWGTVVTFEGYGDADDGSVWRKALAEACDFLHRIDDTFSTYKPSSAVSLVRVGLLSPHTAPSLYREVAARAHIVSEITHDIFDPAVAPGGIDFSGFLKGWAAQESAQIFVREGFPNTVKVNAAGDLWCGGTVGDPGPQWRVGVQHPFMLNRVAAVVTVSDRAVCTSATYHNRAHIIDPRSGAPADSDIISATVVGPDGGIAEALAKVFLICGSRHTDQVFSHPYFDNSIDDWGVFFIGEGGDTLFFGDCFA